jgi:RNA polymerase sporulation-specific sigma factor
VVGEAVVWVVDFVGGSVPDRVEGGGVSEEAHLAKYEWLAWVLASKYFLPGGDRDDLRQIAMLGLLKAVRCYDPSRRVPFTAFATLAIRRQLTTAIREATKQGNLPLNESVREDSLLTLRVVREPIDEIAERDELRRLVGGIKTLTTLERKAIIDVAFRGTSYGVGYGKDKSVDNALQRARRKLAA